MFLLLPKLRRYIIGLAFICLFTSLNPADPTSIWWVCYDLYRLLILFSHVDIIL